MRFDLVRFMHIANENRIDFCKLTTRQPICTVIQPIAA